MKITTFNIRYGTAPDGPFEWRYRRDALFSLLHRIDSDIYCFQEALHFQTLEIAEVLSGFKYVFTGRDDGREGGEGCPVFFRSGAEYKTGTVWLSPTPAVPGSTGWGARLPRILTWVDFGDFTVANTHLDHESLRARDEGIRTILENVKGRTILCGDFNAELNEPLFTRLREFGFEDLAPNSGETYNGFSDEPSGRIDYIFGREVTAVSGEVIRRPVVSDHWPVVVELDISY